MREIQHQIDFIPGSGPPNLPHYRLNPKEARILQEKVEALLQIGHVQESLCPCSVPCGNLWLTFPNTLLFKSFPPLKCSPF